MMYLSREVRFSLIEEGLDKPTTNSWSGWPSHSAISPYLTMRCTLQGELDPDSSYICNIKLIDKAIREKVIGVACDGMFRCYESLLLFAWGALANQFPDNCRLSRLELVATPFLSYSICLENPDMVQLTQQFEFSAAHRLHNPELSEEQNRALFGKCNNPHGHGHNYVVAITVQGTPANDKQLVSLSELEALVKHHVVDRLDHKHLNVEVPEFKDLNPSVENISKVVWGYLQPHLGLLAAEAPLSLANVRVYETPKTWADYQGAN